MVCIRHIYLKKGFMHSDIASHYYPYRYWFSQQLLDGKFPIWNPFWGIGQTTDWFLTFPIDIYTPGNDFWPAIPLFSNPSIATHLIGRLLCLC